MSHADHVLKALHCVLEARGANLVESDLLMRVSTAEVDSLAEEITFADNIPEPRKRQLLDYVRQIVELNAVEGESERQAAALLDELARASHRAECEGLQAAVGVLALARALRPHLAVISNPAAHTGVEYFVACASVRDITRSVPASRLSASSLRSQLGAGRHDLLVNLTGAIA